MISHLITGAEIVAVFALVCTLVCALVLTSRD
jgi:hypothetical protein